MTHPSAIRLAAAPINWCNDDMLDLGDEYSFSDILDDMSRLGFAGTELGRKYPRDAAVLRAALDSRRLLLSSAWTTVHFANRARWEQSLAAFEEQARLLSALGARYIVTCEGSGSVHWDLTGDQKQVTPFDGDEWQAVAQGLNAAGDLAHRYGLRVVYHPHVGTNVQTPEEIDRLMALTDPEKVSLLLDTGHVYMAGGDPLAVARAHGERVRYVHLKDVRPDVLRQVREEQRPFLEAVRLGVFTVPGDGAIDFAPILDVLAQRGYQGWMVIEAEQDPRAAEPVTYMRKSLAYLDRIAGLRVPERPPTGSW